MKSGEAQGNPQLAIRLPSRRSPGVNGEVRCGRRPIMSPLIKGLSLFLA
jgi:hypothetical protein